MPLLEHLPVDQLTPVRLWAELDPGTRTLAAKALFDGDRELREQANQAIATTLKFRAAGVRKLSVDTRIDYLVRRVRPDDALASSLLMVLHLGCRQALLRSFLDELQIPNEDGLIAADHATGPIATERLEPAVGKLRERFDAADVELYLASLLALDPDVWGGLTGLLTHDGAPEPSRARGLGD